MVKLNIPGFGAEHQSASLKGKMTALGAEAGCDPTSLKLGGTHYFDLYKVCNVNNSPKLLPTERNRVGERSKGGAFWHSL